MAITVDQINLGGANFDDGGGTNTLTTTTPAAAGALVVLTGGTFNTSSSVASVSAGGLTWTVQKQGHAANPAGVNPFIAWALAPAGLASSTVITPTFSGTIDVSTLSAHSFLGVDTTTPVGVTSGPTGVSPAATGWTTASMSITAGSLIFAVSWEETTSVSNTPSAGSTELVEVISGLGYGHVAEYRIEPSAGSYTVAGAWSGAVQSTTVAVEFLAAAGAPPAAGRPLHTLTSPLRLS